VLPLASHFEYMSDGTDRQTDRETDTAVRRGQHNKRRTRAANGDDKSRTVTVITIKLAIGNESLPKIIMNNTMNLFLKLQSAFW